MQEQLDGHSDPFGVFSAWAAPGESTVVPSGESARFGNYYLRRLLGYGAFAEVYLAEHIYLSTPAAIKLLTAPADRDGFARFRAEARIVAGLMHPNIIHLLEFGVEGRTPFIVMDYAINGTLRQRHPRGAHLTPTVILPYLRQLASALTYAHSRGLIHRDIKPENMLVDGEGRILLSDFGVAVFVQSSLGKNAGDIAGTATYMAPEQFQGLPGRASDQYSLGIIAYEWLCGRPPFSGTPLEITLQHALAPVAPLRTHNPCISPALERVVLRALAKQPQDRYASVLDFYSAFEAACEGTERPVEDPLSRQPDPSTRPRLPGNPQSVSALPLSPQRPQTNRRQVRRGIKPVALSICVVLFLLCSLPLVAQALAGLHAIVAPTSSGALSSPANTAEVYYQALQQQDAPAAFNYLTRNASIDHQRLSESSFLQMVRAVDAQEGDIIAFTVLPNQGGPAAGTARITLQVVRSGMPYEVDLLLLQQGTRWGIEQADAL